MFVNPLQRWFASVALRVHDMDKAPEEIMKRATSWPKEDQEELARVAREIEAERPGAVYRFSADERAAIEEGLAQAERGDFVPEQEMEAFFRSRKA